MAELVPTRFISERIGIAFSYNTNRFAFPPLEGYLVLSNRSVPTHTVLPHVTYTDVAEAISWLSAHFGFVEHYRYGGLVPSGAQMRLGDAFVMLKQARPGYLTPSQAGGETQQLTIFVPDVQAHFRSTQHSGTRIFEEVNDTVYGERQYGAEDLEGHRWLFSQHIADLHPEQWGATVTQPIQSAEPGIGGAVIQPLLSVRRGAKAIEFYKAAFGAKILMDIVGEDGSVVAELSVGDAVFWLADESPEHFNFSPETLGGASSRMVVIVPDPDALFSRAIQAGGSAIWPVSDQDYGWRVGRLVDPFGHHWEIGKPLSA